MFYLNVMEGIFLEKRISSHLYLPFINIKWGTESVLQETIDNLASIKLKMNSQKNYWPLKISVLKQQEDKKVQLKIQLF